MSPRQGRAAIVLIVCLGLAVAWLFLSPGVEQRIATPTPAASPPPSPSRAATDAIPASVPGPASAPLPPDDAPLSLVAGSLQARADAGDRKAACRLGIELVRCQQLDLMTTHASWRETLTAEGGDAVQVAQRQATLRLVEQCRALPAPLRAQGGRYLVQAARAGEPEAMLRYANGEHFPLDARGLFADPQFDTWRREAPAMMQRAFVAGVPEAAMLMLSAYDDDYGLLSGLVEDDPARAAALHALMIRLHGWNDRSLAARRLDAATLLRARAQAETWHRDLFDGRRYRGRGMLPSAYWPRHDGSPHAFCQDP